MRGCAYLPCGRDFEPVNRGQKYCSHPCSTAAAKEHEERRSKKVRCPNATYIARGITQDNVHPNERGRDMSQYHGTFRIEEGRVITR